MASERPPETELLFDTPSSDAPENQPSETGEMPGVGFGDFLRVIIVLMVIIALIYAFVWMLKKFTGSKTEGSGVIQLYSTRVLKGDAALHLIEAGKKIYLIGSSGTSVTLISEIEDQEAIDEIRLNASITPPKSSGGFAGLFRDRFNPPGSVSANTDQNVGNTVPMETDPGAYLRKQRERLEEL